MNIHEEHMRRALELAKKGKSFVNPNPLVGCVIAKNNEIIGEGWHKGYGKKHAEINAILDVEKRFGKLTKKKLKGSYLYVNLEPCSKQGKTPPCIYSIIKSGISKVFISNRDETQEGIKILSQNRIHVEVGLLKEAGEELNLGFFSRTRKGRPYIKCKIGCSIDGGIALSNGESKWITSNESRLDVHKMRAESDALLTGIGTVMKDNPKLTVRLDKKLTKNLVSQPLRCVVDSNLKITSNENLIIDKFKTIIFCNKIKESEAFNSSVEVIQKPDKKGRVSLVDVVQYLSGRGINDLMVEAGPNLISGFIRERIVDEFIIYIAPKLLGKNKLNFTNLDKTLSGMELKIENLEKIGTDLKIRMVCK